jgi:hypothetical protein
MDQEHRNADQKAAQELDDAWNHVYIRNERAPFEHILADDFFGTFADLTPIRKAHLQVPTPSGRPVSFSERSIHVYGCTGIARGRIRVEHPEGTVEQRYFRVYSKRDGRWQAIAVQVFPIPQQASA